MFTHDPVSLLSLHHEQHARLVADASRASARPLAGLRERFSAAYFAAIRRAYVRARAVRVTASRVTP